MGVTVIAAAGNESSSLPAPPAFYPETISVGAVDASLGLASYSNFGSTIDVVAPGGQIGNDDNDDGMPDGVFSTLGDDGSGEIENVFGFFEGTSMSCPHVSGVVALMLSVNPDLTPKEVKDILTSTAIDLGDPGRDDEFGFGLVDAETAVIIAQVIPPTGDEPIISLSTTTLDFGTTEDQLQVIISNIGGGVLNVTDIIESEINGGDWLEASASLPRPDTNLSLIVVTVDRTDLEPGTFDGVVTVEAEGQDDQNIIISIEVAGGSGGTFDEIVIVEAVNVMTGDIVASTETSEAEDFEYTLSDLPVGTYIIIAGTDLDGDGETCEADDFCGSFDGAATVNPDETTTGIDFTISEN